MADLKVVRLVCEETGQTAHMLVERHIAYQRNIHVAPVRHAYWEMIDECCNHAHEFSCSGKNGCGRHVYYGYYARSCDYDYCPYCGAIMDAKED